MIVHATLIRSTLEAANGNCSSGHDGAAFPNELYVNAGKFHAAANYHLMVRHLHDTAGGAVLTAPAPADFETSRSVTWRASTWPPLPTSTASSGRC